MTYKYRVVEISREDGSAIFELHKAESELKYLCIDGSSTEFPINNDDLTWEYVEEFGCLESAVDRAQFLKGKNVKNKKVVWSD